VSSRIVLLFVICALCGCGGQAFVGAADASTGGDATTTDAGGGDDAQADGCASGHAFGDGHCTGGDAAVVDAGVDAAPLDCTYDDGGAVLDASSRFNGSCDGGCPTGTVCAVQIGGVAGGGGEYCAPIMDRCKNDVSCACLASCVCGASFGRVDRCSDTQQKGTVLECDNGIR